MYLCINCISLKIYNTGSSPLDHLGLGTAANDASPRPWAAFSPAALALWVARGAVQLWVVVARLVSWAGRKAAWKRRQWGNKKQWSNLISPTRTGIDKDKLSVLIYRMPKYRQQELRDESNCDNHDNHGDTITPRCGKSRLCRLTSAVSVAGVLFSDLLRWLSSLKTETSSKIPGCIPNANILTIHFLSLSRRIILFSHHLDIHPSLIGLKKVESL